MPNIARTVHKFKMAKEKGYLEKAGTTSEAE